VWNAIVGDHVLAIVCLSESVAIFSLRAISSAFMSFAGMVSSEQLSLPGAAFVV
jgi:hypothetical protein